MSTAHRKRAAAPKAAPGLSLRIVGTQLVRRRNWLLALAAMGGLIVAGGMIWNRVRPRVFADDAYKLDANRIDVTPRPEWIRSDVEAEVLRDSGLVGTSLLNDRLAEQIHQAFQLHPWIESARVRVYPARVQVDLVFRRPLAMVVVSGGLLPIDAEAIVLPSEDFAPADTRLYPRIAGIDSQPRGLPGTAWGDPTVADAARIIAVLAPSWRELKLQHLQCNLQKMGEPTPAARFSLVTLKGNAIPWDSPPASEAASEPAAKEKLGRLQDFVRAHGSLDDAGRDLLVR